MSTFDRSNIATYTRHVDEYQTLELWPPEQHLLKRFKNDWPHSRVLDLGVGTGRTAYTFSAVAAEYVGVDYVPAMIEACIRRIPTDDNCQFHVGDARRLEFPDAHFDFVLFCWNGIDSIDPDGRTRAIAETARVLKPGGYFFFSSHTMNDLPFVAHSPSFQLSQPLRSLYKLLRYAKETLRLRFQYRDTDWKTLRARPYCLLTPPDHGYGLTTQYTDPRHQVDGLERAGFTLKEIYAPAGQLVSNVEEIQAGYVYYLCQKQPA